MNLPKRDINHVRETASLKIFERIIPNEWIIRELTERDYGIDCYIEICEDGNVSGKLLSIQIKSSEIITPQEKEKTVVYYDVNISTLNYWNLLPVPVLFLYQYIKNELIYFLNVKQAIRENYDLFLSGKYKNLRISSTNILQENNCIPIINKIYLNETGRMEYEVMLTNFLINIPHIYEFLNSHYCRDSFLPLGESDNEDFYFLSLYKEFKYFACKMDIDWNVISIKEIIKLGQKTFGMNYTFYEGAVAEFVHQIVPVFLEILEKAYQVICIKEKDYWFEHNFCLWNYMDLKEYAKYIKDIELLRI